MIRVMAVAMLAMTMAASAAGVSHQYPTPELLSGDTTIIDIRTPGEWSETGVVEGAIPITFFDERGGYDAAEFLRQIEPLVSRDEPFAVICRTGNRTRAVSDFLADQGYQVINLQGGIHYLMGSGYEPVEFAQRREELEQEGQCGLQAMSC